MRMFGAPAARRLGSTRFLYVELSIVTPAWDPEGAGGKGRTSAPTPWCARRSQGEADDRKKCVSSFHLGVQ